MALNLINGEVTATWTVDSTTVNVSGKVKCIESLPNNRFLFTIEGPGPRFYVLTTTNI